MKSITKYIIILFGFKKTIILISDFRISNFWGCKKDSWTWLLSKGISIWDDSIVYSNAGITKKLFIKEIILFLLK